jgi:hypothetical protein
MLVGPFAARSREQRKRDKVGGGRGREKCAQLMVLDGGVRATYIRTASRWRYTRRSQQRASTEYVYVGAASCVRCV